MVEWNPTDDGKTPVYNSLTAAYELTSVLARPVQVVADAGEALAVDVRSYGVVDATLTEACTVSLSGADAGQMWEVTLILRQGGAGSMTVVWPAEVMWAGGTAPTLTETAAAVDVIRLSTPDAGATILGATVGLAFAVPA